MGLGRRLTEDEREARLFLRLMRKVGRGGEGAA